MLSHLAERRAGRHPRDPALASLLGAPAATAAGRAVDEREALGATAVYACVRNTAETLAEMPCRLRRVARDEAGRERGEDALGHPLRRVLLEAPNAWQTAFDFWECVVEHLELRGNHYSVVRRDGAGRAAGLEPLHPDRVDVRWDPSERAPGRRPLYLVEGEAGRSALWPGEIFHVRGPMQGDGLLGSSPIRIHRETVGMALAAREYGARLFANDSRPAGVIETDGVFEDESRREEFKRQWRESYAGQQRHGVAVLEAGLRFKAIGMSNGDAQYIELRGFTDLEIARLFRVPPYKIGVLEKSTLNNVEQQNRAWVTDKLAPLARRIEDAVQRDLIAPSSRGSLQARFDFSQLLRGDVRARTEASARGIQWGWLSPNDVRAREGLNPIGPAGDVYVSPVNMRPMADLLDGSGGREEGAEEGGGDGAQGAGG